MMDAGETVRDGERETVTRLVRWTAVEMAIRPTGLGVFYCCDMSNDKYAVFGLVYSRSMPHAGFCRLFMTCSVPR